MADEQPVHEGGCLCGAVRFRAQGAPQRTLICHCRICSQHTGAPFVLLGVFARDAVSVSGETLGYRSSEHVLRLRCANCGSQFGIIGEKSGVMEIYSGCLDDPQALAPEYEIFTVHRPHWLPRIGGIPHHERFRG